MRPALFTIGGPNAAQLARSRRAPAIERSTARDQRKNSRAALTPFILPSASYRKIFLC
jgi:hypothetical protein